jgi:hypothetical protein
MKILITGPLLAARSMSPNIWESDEPNIDGRINPDFTSGQLNLNLNYHEYASNLPHNKHFSIFAGNCINYRATTFAHCPLCSATRLLP